MTRSAPLSLWATTVLLSLFRSLALYVAFYFALYFALLFTSPPDGGLHPRAGTCSHDDAAAT